MVMLIATNACLSVCTINNALGYGTVTCPYLTMQMLPTFDD